MLGIVGAFLYRMVDWLVDEDRELIEDQKGLFRRLQQIMDWPAAQLMTLSLAIASDFAAMTYRDIFASSLASVRMISPPLLNEGMIGSKLNIR